MPRTIHIQHTVQTRTDATDRALEVAAMFGLTLDGRSEQVVLPPTKLALSPGRVVFVTGLSGGGKSTLLRLVANALIDGQGNDVPGLVCADRLPALSRAALVDALAQPEGGVSAEPATLKQVCGWLSRAGLNDAAVMLRRPNELSEGQRHRLRVAQAIAVAERSDTPWSVLLVDEFGSTLDRTTAQAMARSVAKWVRRSGVCLVAATAHDDLLEPLSPDVLVEVNPGDCAVNSVHA